MTKSAFDFSFGVPVPFKHFFEKRERAIGSAVHQSLDREHFQVFVALGIGARSLARALAHFDLERAGVFLPAALREAMLQFGEGCECGVAFALTILGVGLPVESSVGLRAVALGEFGEGRCGAVVTIFVEGFATIFVELLIAFANFLFSIAFLLLTIALLLLLVTLFLFAIAFFLIAVGLRLLGILESCAKSSACS